MPPGGTGARPGVYFRPCRASDATQAAYRAGSSRSGMQSIRVRRLAPRPAGSTNLSRSGPVTHAHRSRCTGSRA